MATLASTLLNAQVVDIASTSYNSNSPASRDNPSGSRVAGTSQPTLAATSIPNSGGSKSNESTASSDALGTVASAIVTRINGDIRYILVRPEGALAEQIREAGLNNQNTAQSSTAQPTGQATRDAGSGTNGASQMGTIQPTSIPNAGGNSTPTGAFQNTVQPTASPTPGSSVPSTAQPTGIPNTGRNSAQGEILVPVPFNAVPVSSGENGLVLRPSRFMLQNAPSLNAAALPDVLGFGFDQGIMSFWTTGSLSNNQGGVSNGNGGTSSP